MTTIDYDALFEAHRRDVWGVCYRMTGSASDADDLLQETFARAMERPPADLSRPWRPWLIQVAVNQARDLLRARRRRGYVGVWLPEPVQLPDLTTPPPSGRYERLESATLAFLAAIEALTPQQRAILLLRDALDYSTAEAAQALSISEANVKTTLHRARKRMEGYDRQRCRPTPATAELTRAALRDFLMAVAAGDSDAMASMLTEDALYAGDSDGRYWNATRVLRGRERVLTFLLGVSSKHAAPPTRIEEITCNGLPAALIEVAAHHPRIAPRFIFQITRAPQGGLERLFIISAPDKLTAW